MDSLFRQVLFVSGVTLALGGVAQAGEFRRFPDYAYEAKGEADIDALKELLRQAQELQKSQDAVKAAADLEAAAAEPPAVTAAPAGPESAAKPESKPAAKAPPEPTRSGCMYRDQKLIWERVPGACKP